MVRWRLLGGLPTVRPLFMLLMPVECLMPTQKASQLPRSLPFPCVCEGEEWRRQGLGAAYLPQPLPFCGSRGGGRRNTPRSETWCVSPRLQAVATQKYYDWLAGLMEAWSGGQGLPRVFLNMWRQGTRLQLVKACYSGAAQPCGEAGKPAGGEENCPNRQHLII